MNNDNTFVLSLGGSIIVPDEINTEFLRGFRDLVVKHVEQGKRFVIITGGGSTARLYNNAAAAIDEEVSDEDRDWLGIHGTRINAQLIRTIFKKYAYPRINTNPHDLEDFLQCKDPVIVAAGWRPGWSTDYCAVLLAKYLNIPHVVNLSNIDYVFDDDPKVNPNAVAQKEMTWDSFRELVGNEWTPGMNAPFDPIASKFAQENDLSVAVMNGKNIPNLDAYLNGGDFDGTLIQK